MKKLVNCCLIFGLFLFAFAAELPQLLQADTATAYAMDSSAVNKHGGGNGNGGGNGGGYGGGIGGGKGHQVPEPGMLSLLGTSIAGCGIAYFIRRKNRK